MQLVPYLAFDGQCKEALQFYEKCFDGTIDCLMTNAESPMAKHFPPEQQDRVMHARLSFGGNVLMAADAPPEHYKKPAGFSVSIHLQDVSQGKRIFESLSQGGAIEMPIQETFWSPGFGMVTDRYGIHWMINCEQPVQ
jgi:PhnB protein